MNCPFCKSNDIGHAADWTARSNEKTESGDECILEEYQCMACGLSFWIGREEVLYGKEEKNVY